MMSNSYVYMLNLEMSFKLIPFSNVNFGDQSQIIQESNFIRKSNLGDQIHWFSRLECCWLCNW